MDSVSAACLLASATAGSKRGLIGNGRWLASTDRGVARINAGVAEMGVSAGGASGRDRRGEPRNFASSLRPTCSSVPRPRSSSPSSSSVGDATVRRRGGRGALGGDFGCGGGAGRSEWRELTSEWRELTQSLTTFFFVFRHCLVLSCSVKISSRENANSTRARCACTCLIAGTHRPERRGVRRSDAGRRLEAFPNRLRPQSGHVC